MPSLKRVVIRVLGGFVLVLCLAASPAALAGETPFPGAQSSNGSGMGVPGRGLGGCFAETPAPCEQTPISKPAVVFYVDPDPIIFIPPLTETP